MFSVRKKPVDLSCGPLAKPPYLSQPAGPELVASSTASVELPVIGVQQANGFARPVFVLVLAEGVNEREEWLRICDPGSGWSVFSDSVIGHFKTVILVWPAHKDYKLRHVFHIQSICVAGCDRIAAQCQKAFRPMCCQFHAAAAP